jgi:transposase
MYQDEAVFQQSGSISRSWALRGVGTEVLSFPTRKSVKVMGAVALGRGPKWHSRMVNTFNGETFLSFLRQLLRQYPDRKIHLICDNAPYHKTLKISQWLKAHEDRIELFFLPPYSPEFNAVEYVWKETRRKTTHNRFFKTLNDLKSGLATRFNRFQGNPGSLSNILKSFA